jgi:hypothetical protein
MKKRAYPYFEKANLNKDQGWASCVNHASYPIYHAIILGEPVNYKISLERL